MKSGHLSDLVNQHKGIAGLTKEGGLLSNLVVEIE